MLIEARQERYTKHLDRLIEEGQLVANFVVYEYEAGNAEGGKNGRFSTASARQNEWLTEAENIVKMLCHNRPHYARLQRHLNVEVADEADYSAIVGILQAVRLDLLGGLLVAEELLMAAHLFSSILEQAKHLSESGYIEPAAVLTRIVIEDTINRLAIDHGIDVEKKKLTSLNDELKQAEVYSTMQWRQIQMWLDLGNSAAHGNFKVVTQANVTKTIDEVEVFLTAQIKGV